MDNSNDFSGLTDPDHIWARDAVRSLVDLLTRMAELGAHR